MSFQHIPNWRSPIKLFTPKLLLLFFATLMAPVATVAADYKAACWAAPDRFGALEPVSERDVFA